MARAKAKVIVVKPRLRAKAAAPNCGGCMYSYVPPEGAAQAGHLVCARRSPYLPDGNGHLQPPVEANYWCAEFRAGASPSPVR